MTISTNLVYMGVKEIKKGDKKYLIMDLYDDSNSHTYGLFINDDYYKTISSYKKFTEYNWKLKLYYDNKKDEMRLSI